MRLQRKRVSILVEDNLEDAEVIQSFQAIKEALGAEAAASYA